MFPPSSVEQAASCIAATVTDPAMARRGSALRASNRCFHPAIRCAAATSAIISLRAIAGTREPAIAPSDSRETNRAKRRASSSDNAGPHEPPLGRGVAVHE